MATLVGRDEERARIDDLTRRVGEGASGVLLVTGEPGVGKSALLDDAAARAQAAGWLVLGATAVEVESQLPYAVVSELAGDLVDARAGLPAVQRTALATALALEEGPAPDAHLVGAALVSLLGAAARDGQRLLALVDDAQWADEASLLLRVGPCAEVPRPASAAGLEGATFPQGDGEAGRSPGHSHRRPEGLVGGGALILRRVGEVVGARPRERTGAGDDRGSLPAPARRYAASMGERNIDAAACHGRRGPATIV